jgi:hypothetical protein
MFPHQLPTNGIVVQPQQINSFACTQHKFSCADHKFSLGVNVSLTSPELLNNLSCVQHKGVFIVYPFFVFALVLLKTRQ